MWGAASALSEVPMRLGTLLLRAATLIAILTLGASSPARSSPPNAANSTVPRCLEVCPYGDITFDVVVRDVASNPVAGSSVAIFLPTCSAFQLCVNQGDPNLTIGTSPLRALKVTSATGAVSFHLHAGGVCPGTTVSVYADGVLLAQPSLSSPDQNGDLDVSNGDVLAVQAKTSLPFDATADLTCDGVVDANDVNAVNAHYGHTCDAIVPTQNRSWGGIKIHYR
jgi:hypothetical protein